MSRCVDPRNELAAAAAESAASDGRAARSMALSLWVVLFALLALLGAMPHPLAGSASEEASVPQAQSCLASQCHEYRMAFWNSPHSALDTQGLAGRSDASWSCAACHGEPRERQKGADEPGCTVDVFSFGSSDLPREKSERCLKCHRADHPGFTRSSHARSGLDCTVCHGVHEANPGRWPLQRALTTHDGNALRSEPVGAICVSCHSDVFAEFELNERHRLHEGSVVCTDCHDPHRRQPRLDLGGFRQQACARCHRDKGGPFLFEHEAQRIEGCVSCHTAHGSVNRHLLAFQQVSDLCYSCHVAVPGFHLNFPLDTQCTNCHTSIHGSNLDAHFLK